MKLTVLTLAFILLLIPNSADRGEQVVLIVSGAYQAERKSGKEKQVLKDAVVPEREWVPDSPAMKVYKALTDKPWKVILLVIVVGGFMFAIGRWRGKKVRG